jgi:hypothetical protein
MTLKRCAPGCCGAGQGRLMVAHWRYGTCVAVLDMPVEVLPVPSTQYTPVEQQSPRCVTELLHSGFL